MQGDALSLMKDLDACSGKTHIEVLSCQLIRGAVVMTCDLEMGVGSNTP